MSTVKLPTQGIGVQAIHAAFRDMRQGDDDPRATFNDRWLNDRGLLIDDGTLDVAMSAHAAFFTKPNSHGPILALEDEMISMTLDLFRATGDGAGSVTSGGTESLFLATVSALMRAKSRKNPTGRFELLLVESGYPSLDKYARFLDYDVVRVPATSAYKADVPAMESAINDRTFMIVGSLPPWSHGVCDPISEIAHVAHRHDLWFHVDACVGGYLAPFMRDLGESVPDFDFSLPGVCSISADLHKYGYGAKGVSLVLYANQDLARFQPFEFDQWASGLYRSATLTGTRSGGAIAASWAVMKFLGRAGYGRRTSQILKAKAALCSAIASDADLRLVGQPELATIAVAAHDIDIYAVAEQLSSRGWAINLLRDPPALQFVIGPLKDEFIEELARDLTQSSERVRRESLTAAVARVVYSDEIPRRQPGTA